MKWRTILFSLFWASLWACASEPNQPSNDEGGVSLLWGGLSPTCVDPNSFNGANADEVPILQFDDGPPSDIDRLVVRLIGQNCKGSVGAGPNCIQEIAFPLDQISLTSSGILEVKGVDPDIPQTLKLFGCKGNEEAPRWSGTAFDVLVEENGKETVFILMTPEEDLSCPTGSIVVGDTAIGSPVPFTSGNTSFGAMTTMNSGDIVLAGGFNESLTGTHGVSLLDTETGTWLEHTDTLLVARGMANAYPLDERNVVVFGGSPKLEIKRDRTEPPFLFPGGGAAEFDPNEFVEIVDVVAGTSTSLALPSALDAGVTSFPAMASTQYTPAQDNILVVGGVRGDIEAKDFADAGALSDQAIRIHGVTAPSPQVSAITLATPRVGAALLSTIDGHLIIFGGNYDGEPDHLIEWIGKDWGGSSVLPTENLVLNDGLTLSDIDPVGFASTVLLEDESEERTWLILGGQASIGGGYQNKIENGQILLVHVASGGSEAPIVTIDRVDSTDTNLGTRAFAHLSKTNDNRLLLVGGVASVTAINLGDECTATEGQCLRKNASILSYDANSNSLSVDDEIEIGPALGVQTATRLDGTYALSPGLDNIKSNEVKVGLPSLLWNPLSNSDSSLCKSSIPQQ